MNIQFVTDEDKREDLKRILLVEGKSKMSERLNIFSAVKEVMYEPLSVNETKINQVRWRVYSNSINSRERENSSLEVFGDFC